MLLPERERFTTAGKSKERGFSRPLSRSFVRVGVLHSPPSRQHMAAKAGYPRPGVGRSGEAPRSRCSPPPWADRGNGRIGGLISLLTLPHALTSTLASFGRDRKTSCRERV